MRRVMKLMVMILHVAFLRFQDVLGLRGVRGFGFERDWGCGFGFGKIYSALKP